VKRIIFTLIPKTAFATPLHGDTLFGQCCWAIRHLHGEAKLTELLAGYTQNKPFMVIADALPQGIIARPSLPTELLGFDTSDTQQRKAQKGKKWFPVSVLNKPLKQWADTAQTDAEMLTALGLKGSYLLAEPQDHNSLNRLTGTTAKGEGFAPFQRLTYCFHPGIELTLIVELDENRLSADELLEVLQWVGLTGYGKEASCGLGKFEAAPADAVPLEFAQGDAWLTLAACAPQGLNWDAANCYYQTFTRFGRHGDLAVHQGSPFKNPVLLAQAFAVLTPQAMNPDQSFIGQGLDGVSKTIKETVQQGYAPVLPVALELNHG
jgi:CRISPR-associated protein Csm4